MVWIKTVGVLEWNLQASIEKTPGNTEPVVINQLVEMDGKKCIQKLFGGSV